MAANFVPLNRYQFPVPCHHMAFDVFVNFGDAGDRNIGKLAGEGGGLDERQHQHIQCGSKLHLSRT